MFVEKHTILHLADTFGMPSLPQAIDLGSADAAMALAQLETGLAYVSPDLRAAILRTLRLDVPAPESHGHGVVVLPGGALALRSGLEGVLVCDPATATVFTPAQSATLRAAMSDRLGVLTVSNGPAGLQLAAGVPQTGSAQACSIVADAAQLDMPGLSGRMVVQWRAAGAVAWGLAEAPSILALAASVAGRPLQPRAAALAADLWAGGDLAGRAALLAPGLHERVSDLLMDEVGDTLRWDLAARAISGPDNLADRMADALRLLPVLFTEDGVDAGASLLAAWPRAAELLHAAPGQVLIGIEAGAADEDAIGTIRAVLAQGAVFAEDNGAAPVALAAMPAARLVRHAADDRRIGVLLAAPDAPDALYALGERLAGRLDGRVVMAAPGWGFFHRVCARTGTEAGNAACFGLGAALDELEWL